MPTVILLDVSLSMCRSVNQHAKSFRRNKDHLESSTQQESSNGAGQPLEIRQLANVGIGFLLDYFAQNAQLEHVAFVVFSSLWEIKHQFTRQYEIIKNGIYDLELYDKSNIINALRGGLSLRLDEWAQSEPINIILITDGQAYNNVVDFLGEEPEESDPEEFHDIPLGELEGHFEFPCKIQIVCLTSADDPALANSIPFFKKLASVIDKESTDCPVVKADVDNSKNLNRSAIWIPNSDSTDISAESIEKLFSQISECHYKTYQTILSCGHLNATVMLSPRPTECLLKPLKNDFDDLKNEIREEDARETYVSAINKVKLFKLNDQIEICGFMPLSEISSPPVTSRHLVLPIPSSKFNETSKAEQILSQDSNAYCKSLQICPDIGLSDVSNSLNSSITNRTHISKDKSITWENPKSKGEKIGRSESQEQDVAKQPSFCILLQTCLKQENLVAVCIMGKDSESNEEWYGMLHSQLDNKKRSSLMLSLFIPGSNPILWLPNFKSLGSVSLNADLPPAIRDRITNSRGPLKSYSSNSVLWLDPESVQADVQKIVRHAKRAPDKAPHFYKELNRVRRAAISYGFYDVLHGLASILERERRIMVSDPSKVVNPETLRHIDHVVASLRADLNEESYNTNIIPPLDS